MFCFVGVGGSVVPQFFLGGDGGRFERRACRAHCFVWFGSLPPYIHVYVNPYNACPSPRPTHRGGASPSVSASNSAGCPFRAAPRSPNAATHRASSCMTTRAMDAAVVLARVVLAVAVVVVVVVAAPS
jgi:hypothetical protein